MSQKLTQVGRHQVRLDAEERVSGRATYTGDVILSDMLYARVLRSPHPHARILHLDVSRARALAGVEAIITHQNCSTIWSSGDSRRPRRLFNNPVRFVGDAVAAVAARDRHTAEQALALIEVEYEPLDFVLDPEEALQPEAVKIYPEGNLSPDREGKLEPEVYSRGDIEKGLRDSDLVVEETFVSKHINNAQMEPRASIARWEGEELTVWASTQGISNCQRDLAHDLDLPLEKVRVICQFMGGGFGNKNQCQDFDLTAAVLARETGRPVKLEFTRREDFIAVHGRWPTRQYYRAGVKRDGTLQAIHLRGYSGMGPYRKSTGDIAGTELYRCPNLKTEIYPVHTNMAVAANFRAPAYPQGVFGIESLMDEVAHRLQINPLEFRIRNATRKYRDEFTYSSYGLLDCLQKGGEIFGWKDRWRPADSHPGPLKKGVGVAMGAFPSRVGRSAAVLRLDGRGDVWVHVGVTDIGTGAKTTMALLAAEALEMDLDRIHVVWGDTDRCPYSVGESGSRTTNYTGHAIVEAARQLRRKLSTQGPPQGDDVLVAEATPEPSLKEGIARYSFSVQFAEVEVDVELGDVRVTEFLSVQDCGRVVNPVTATSQVKGGVTMGIGMALHEELLYDQATGKPLTPGFYGARVMTHLDTPEVEVHFIEPADEYGPFGAKALGELPIVPTVAAVANAVCNATGRRFRELPITRQRILEAQL